MFSTLKLLGFTFILLGLFSCGDSVPEDQDGTEQVQDSTQVYGTASVQLPRFIAGATPIVAVWPIYDEFEEELVALNSTALAELRSRSERFIVFADSLAKTLPDTLNKQPIASRLIVLNTRVRLLEQAVNSQRPKDSIIHNCFIELNTALGNLKNQINEKLLKDTIDKQRKENEEAELEKQRSVLDSIAQAEGFN